MGIVVPIALVVLGMVFFRWPVFARFSPADRANRKGIIDGIYRAIANRAGANGTRPFVLLTGTGDLNSSLYQYYALKEGRPLDVFMPPDTNVPDVYLPLYDVATFIVAAEPETDIYVNYLLNSRIQATLLEQVRDYRHFTRCRIWIDPGLHIRGEADWEGFKEGDREVHQPAGQRSLYLFEPHARSDFASRHVKTKQLQPVINGKGRHKSSCSACARKLQVLGRKCQFFFFSVPSVSLWSLRKSAASFAQRTQRNRGHREEIGFRICSCPTSAARTSDTAPADP